MVGALRRRARAGARRARRRASDGGRVRLRCAARSLIARPCASSAAATSAALEHDPAWAGSTGDRIAGEDLDAVRDRDRGAARPAPAAPGPPVGIGEAALDRLPEAGIDLLLVDGPPAGSPADRALALPGAAAARRPPRPRRDRGPRRRRPGGRALGPRALGARARGRLRGARRGPRGRNGIFRARFTITRRGSDEMRSRTADRAGDRGAGAVARWASRPVRRRRRRGHGCHRTVARTSA